MASSKDYVTPEIKNRENLKKKPTQPKTSCDKILPFIFKKVNLFASNSRNRIWEGMSSWMLLITCKILWKVRSLEAFALHDCILTILSPNWLCNNPLLEWPDSFYARAAHAVSLEIFLSFFKLHDLLQLSKSSPTGGRGLSLLFWHYLNLIPRVQENSSVEIGVR